MFDKVDQLRLSVVDSVLKKYPFGEIVVGKSPTGSNSITADGADFRRATGGGAFVVIDPSVTCVRGASKATAAGASSLISIGASTTLDGCSFSINGDHCAIIIGENCRLKGLTIQVRRANSVVVIGSECTWESGTILSESGDVVALGNDCMVSNSVILRTSDGHTIFDACTQEPINLSKDVFIGHHVWLGNSSRVNKGAHVGSGSVLGQCAIASGKLAGNSIFAGTPARKVRDGIVWSRTEHFSNIPDEYLPVS